MKKFLESRAKAEAGLKTYRQQIIEALDNAERKVGVDRLVNLCETSMTKAFGKQE